MLPGEGQHALVAPAADARLTSKSRLLDKFLLECVPSTGTGEFADLEMDVAKHLGPNESTAVEEATKIIKHSTVSRKEVRSPVLH